MYSLMAVLCSFFPGLPVHVPERAVRGRLRSCFTGFRDKDAPRLLCSGFHIDPSRVDVQRHVSVDRSSVRDRSYATMKVADED